MDQMVAQKLVDIVSRPVDDAARRRATRHVTDWIACAALGSSSPIAEGFLALARESDAGEGFTMRVGSRSAGTAAFTNGALGNIFEMDDIHRTSIVHAGDVVIPAALAAAQDGSQAQQLSGGQFLDAIVAGYEAAIRIGSAAGAGHYERWYNTATCSVFGAAVAAGRIMGLSPIQLSHAVSHAGMQTTGLWQCRLEPGGAKQLATAHAAAAGLQAAKLAGHGVEGPMSIFEGSLGFFPTMAPSGKPEDVIPEPNANWLIYDVSFKPWPACRHSHPVIEAALDLRETGAGFARNEQIASVEIETYGAAVDFCDDPMPDTGHRGRFSLQHVFAVTWLCGVPTLSDFEPEALNDPTIAALRTKIKIAEDVSMTRAFPHSYGARLTVTFEAGRQEESVVQTAKGDPENPMTDDELAEKAALLLTQAGLASDEIERLSTAVSDLPNAPDLTALNAALTRLTTSSRKETEHAAE